MKAECKDCNNANLNADCHGKKEFRFPEDHECSYGLEWFPDAACMCPEFYATGRLEKVIGQIERREVA